ncbi:MAG: hypothetical protein IPJ28_00470 [Betaproteobacteria bacterium]|nr:hypothetical protein [Betaproteobacteria bacterium]
MPASCGVSSSTCEKSGFTVASTTMSARGRHFTSTPGTASWSLERPSGPRSRVPRTVSCGVTARCRVEGRSSSPVSGRFRHRKQFESRGSGLEAMR